MRDIENVYEPDVKIEGKTHEHKDVLALWAKNELIFRQVAAFNRPLIQTGKQCMNYVHGEIFDANTRSIYENIQNKICIEPRVLKSRMNSAVGQVMKARRNGKVTTEGGASAESVSVANVLLKFIEKEIAEKYLLNKMLFDGCTTGYPQVLLFDVAETSYGDPLGGLSAELCQWDATALSHIMQPDGSDATDLFRLCRKTRQELIDENPEREDEIKHFNKYLKQADGYGMSAMLENAQGLTIEDARNLHFDVMTGLSHNKMDGRSLVVERLCTVKVNTEVAIAKSPQSNETLDYQILPPRWDAARKAAWKAANPHYKCMQKATKLLWHLRWTREGLMLKNEVHWFQESNSRGNPIIPMTVFTPQIIDGLPTGPGPDDRPLVLMKAIAETELLHDIRTGSGDLFAYKKGAVDNYQDLPTELSIGGQGVVVVDGTAAPGRITDNVTFLKRTANKTYNEYSQKIDGDLDNTDQMTPSVRGQMAPYQSAKAKASDIGQALVGYSQITENFNRTYERAKNIELACIPYAFTEQQTINIEDEDYGQNISVVVNETRFDINGEPVIIANDLSSAKWKYRLAEADDSPTAREAELKEMLIFWNTTAPSLIEADESLMTLSSVLQSMSNRTAKEIGRVIGEKAQVKAQQLSQQQMMEVMADLELKKSKATAEQLKARRSGFSFSITPDDLNKIPGLYPILVESGYINPQGNSFQHPAAMQGAPQSPEVVNAQAA